VQEVGEVPRDTVQLILPHRLVHGDALVVDQPRVREQDDQNPVRSDGDEFHPAEPAFLGSQHHGNVGRQGRQEFSRLPQQLFHFALGRVHLLFDLLDFIPTQLGTIHQRVHVEPVSPLRWDPTRRGVGLRDVTQLLQAGHGAANGRWTQGEAVLAGNGARSDRLCCSDIVHNDGAKHAQMSGIQHVLHLDALALSPRERHLLRTIDKGPNVVKGAALARGFSGNP
jgi:hypothetical protein